MLATHYLLLYALFGVKIASHDIRNWWNMPRQEEMTHSFNIIRV